MYTKLVTLTIDQEISLLTYTHELKTNLRMTLLLLGVSKYGASHDY